MPKDQFTERLLHPLDGGRYDNMKPALLVFLVVAFLPLDLNAVDENPSPDSVVVKSLTQSLPSEESGRRKFLWDRFANKPDEQKFNSYTTENWRPTFDVFATALVKKAEGRKLESLSLRKALDLIKDDAKGRKAYLPVGAYQTTLDDASVWIVTVKWERSSRVVEGESLGLSHIRAFAFDQKTLKQVGFMTCK